MRKFLSGLLKYYRYTIIMFITIAGVFALFAWLYGLPAEAIAYAVLICFTGGIVTGIIRYRTFYHKYRRLDNMKSGVQFNIEDLPDTGNDIEAAYAQLLQILYKEQKDLAIESRGRARNAKEYYTMWVHQIKTPIAAMRLLLQSEGEVGKEALSAELFEIEQYVEMVLSYARLESDSSDYLIDYYELDNIIRQVIRKYARLFIRKKISLNFHESEISILTDEKWLVFAVEQILSNALKYTSKGNIDIRVEKETKTLIIEDTGIGIAEEDLPRIFEQGYTGYNGRENKKSTGIGLYLVKTILDKLSHTIEIQSKPGKGTAVRIGLDSASGEQVYFE